jgi:hypothetical protein
MCRWIVLDKIDRRLPHVKILIVRNIIYLKGIPASNEEIGAGYDLSLRVVRDWLVTIPGAGFRDVSCRNRLGKFV